MVCIFLKREGIKNDSKIFVLSNEEKEGNFYLMSQRQLEEEKVWWYGKIGIEIYWAFPSLA